MGDYYPVTLRPLVAPLGPQFFLVRRWSVVEHQNDQAAHDDGQFERSYQQHLGGRAEILG